MIYLQRKDVDGMKKLIAFVLAVLCVVSLAGCGSKTVRFDIGEASVIHIQYRNGKDYAFMIEDDEFTRNITENINALRFEKTAEADGREDYVYILTWIDAKEKEMESITITEENGYQIRYEGSYYKVANDLCIDVALINEQIDIALSSGPASVLKE